MPYELISSTVHDVTKHDVTYQYPDGSVLLNTQLSRRQVMALLGSFCDEHPWAIGSWCYRLGEVAMDRPLDSGPCRVLAMVEDLKA